jgi:hypothetical protein
VFKEPYNKRFINHVLLGLYGEVFAFGLSAQTSLLRRSVCTKTSSKYFPVQTSLSVNKPLLQIVYILLSFQNISTEKSELFAIANFSQNFVSGYCLKFRIITNISNNFGLLLGHFRVVLYG